MYSEQSVQEFLERKLDSWDWIKQIPKKELIEQVHELAGGHYFKTEPFTHQLACFLLGIHKKSFLFLLDPGTGKSMVALNLVSYLKNKGEVKKTLILVPYTITIQSWEDEIKKHSNLKYLPLLGTSKQRWKLLETANDYDLVGLSYPGLVAMIDYTKQKGRYKQEIIFNEEQINKFVNHFDAVIYDESHVVGGHNTITTNICKYISNKCKYKYSLTGTPFSKSLEKLWSQFYLIDGGETLGKTISFYRQVFFNQKINRWGGYVYTINEKNKDKLIEFIKNSSVRYEEKEVSDLPEKVNIQKRLHCTTQQLDFYRKALEGIIEAKGNIKLLENAFVKLRQITSGFVKFVTDEGEKVEIVFDENPKLEALMEIINEVGEEEKVIVFNDYVLTGDIICNRLKQEKIGFERLYGATENKFETMQNFKYNKDCRVYVINSKSGSMSLNLQFARYGVFFETPLEQLIRVQAAKRYHRTGSTQRVFEYDLVMSNTIDEVLMKYVKEGKDLYNEFLNNSKVLLEEFK